tara:strand:+ start:730 stop:906 length:177 start_codon:yes stop_codon:yes gene_type:complete
MLIKESILEVARKLKKGNEFDYQDNAIFDAYPSDVSRRDLENALLAIAVVSEELMRLD